MNKLTLSIAIISVTVLGTIAYLFLTDSDEQVDTSLNGAYQVSDGRLITIGPLPGNRYRMMDIKASQPYALAFNDNDTFEATKGFNTQNVVAKGNISLNENGDFLSLNWMEDDQQKVVKKLPFERQQVFFKSGDLTLKGELTLPQGEGPFPIVITVHGSESYSAVDYYHWPYIFAAQGIAGFKFDKRGTGGSEGEYTQNFSTLAGDVIAAIDYLKKEHNVDPERINLIGFSQGGWIAPLVASQVDIHSYLVAFGTNVPVQEEDRWGYVKQLLDHGFGAREIALADEMNEQLNRIIYQHDENAWDPLFALIDKHENTEWFNAISGSDSTLGFAAEKVNHPLAVLVPDFGWKLYTKWKQGDTDGKKNFNQNYEPMNTLQNLNTPSLWLLAGEDSSLPTQATVDNLLSLKRSGAPIDYAVYPNAEHGNVQLITDSEGNKTYTRYVERYYPDVVSWFVEQNEVVTTPLTMLSNTSQQENKLPK